MVNPKVHVLNSEMKVWDDKLWKQKEIREQPAILKSQDNGN